jgi:hypothetical protein
MFCTYLSTCSAPQTQTNTTARRVVFTAEQAREIAQQFLKTHGFDWGDPIQVIEQVNEHRFLVSYHTPDGEKVNLGPRGVFVEYDGRPWGVPRG